MMTLGTLLALDLQNNYVSLNPMTRGSGAQPAQVGEDDVPGEVLGDHVPQQVVCGDQCRTVRQNDPVL